MISSLNWGIKGRSAPYILQELCPMDGEAGTRGITLFASPRDRLTPVQSS